MYGTSSSLNSISLLDGKIISDLSVDIIESNNKNNKIKFTTGTEVNYWYGKTFISYAYQKIVNTKNIDIEKKRYVYYINKINFL